MSKLIEAVLVGAGERGRNIIGQHALSHPGRLKIVAVAEPNAERRDRFAREHGIAADRCFADFVPLFERPQMAPVCFNTTMDRQHLPSALMAMECGYDLFLEKPMAVTPEECLKIVSEAKRLKRMVQICHPLRFTPFYTKVKTLLEAGSIGAITSLTMHENVAHWHFAHSYVRGNWCNADTSGPLILTKCCHDMDIAVWLVDSPVKRVSSFGSRLHFTEANAPEGAPERCADGCPVENECPHFAPAIYLTDNTNWPASVISVDSSLEARRRALAEGPYGKCVYRSDNSVVDHQVVAVAFESGATLDFAVRACTAECYRTLRILGTEGELNGHLERGEIAITRFRQGLDVSREREVHTVTWDDGTHLGGDPRAIDHFLECHERGDHEAMDKSLTIALEAHLLAFAAERARVSGDSVLV